MVNTTPPPPPPPHFFLSFYYYFFWNSILLTKSCSENLCSSKSKWSLSPFTQLSQPLTDNSCGWATLEMLINTLCLFNIYRFVGSTSWIQWVVGTVSLLTTHSKFSLDTKIENYCISISSNLATAFTWTISLDWDSFACSSTNTTCSASR